MFGFIGFHASEHYIDRGCVQCPRRGRDVELDLCAGCESLETIELRAEPPYVRCRSQPRVAFPVPW